MCLIPEPNCFPLPQLLLPEEWLSLHFAAEAFSPLDHVNYFSYSTPATVIQWVEAMVLSTWFCFWHRLNDRNKDNNHYGVAGTVPSVRHTHTHTHTGDKIPRQISI